MKLQVATLALAALAGCATSSPRPFGVAPGKFVTFACAGGKTFALRAADGGESVRVRAHHGSAELDRQGSDVFEGEGYRLVASGGTATLLHQGKPQGEGCRPAA